MSNVLPFGRKPDDNEPDNLPVVIDVDGDGTPDLVTPPPREQSRLPVPVERAELVAAGDIPVDAEDEAPTIRASVLARRDADRRPIFPAWATSKTDRRQTVRWLARFYGHAAAFHAVRIPQYLGRIAYRAPIGVVKASASTSRWLGDAEAKPLRREAVRTNDPKAYMLLARQQRDRARWRWTVVIGASVLLLAGAIAASVVLPAPVLLALLAAVVVSLAWFGSSADKPLVQHAASKAIVPKLRPEVIEAALGSLGLAGITAALGKGGTGINFPSPIARDGAGWLAEIDLPLGVTVGDIMDRRSRLASGLRRPLGSVWPEAAPQVHEGRLRLWVGDRDMSEAGPLTWSLARHGQHDMFRPVPFGADPRGRGVGVPLIQHNVLIGSLPGQGKTAAVRVLACAAALDPTAELWLHELKGSGDLDPLEQVAHRFISGIDDESIAYAADSLTVLRREVMRRADTLKKLPRDLCPDKRVTRSIADKRALRLHPLVCVVDEAQNLFAHPAFGGQAGTDAEFIIKIGRAFGVVLILATQRPDKDSLPTGVSGNVSIRFCLKVAGQVENDMILGTSAYKNGVRATSFRPEVDAGIGYLAGASAMPQVVRTAYLSLPATERVAARARRMREAEGRLTGHAIGDLADQAVVITVNVVEDVRAVYRRDEDALWNETLLGRLRELRPGFYDAWTPAGLTAALKQGGVERAGSQVERADPETGERRNRRGVYLADLQAAIPAGPDTAIEP